MPLPGDVDQKLNEFWVGNPWEIFQQHNLSCYERNRLYLNAGGAGFLDMSLPSGADVDGDSRSVVAVDVNHDGRLDMILRQAGGTPLIAYENRFPNAHWLDVTLRGTKRNRTGIGARLTAYVGDRPIIREYYPANTFRSQSPSRVHFGLGTAEQIDRLVIRWPSGDEQEFRDLAGNRHLVLTEGESQIEAVAPGGSLAP